MMKDIYDQFDRVIRINRVAPRVDYDELQRLREFLSYGMIFNMDYTWGYTTALLDMKALLESGFFERICKLNKIPKNFKTMRMLVDFMIENREVLRDRCKGWEMGYDVQKKKFYRCYEKTVKVMIEEVDDDKEVEHSEPIKQRQPRKRSEKKEDKTGFELKPYGE